MSMGQRLTHLIGDAHGLFDRQPSIGRFGEQTLDGPSRHVLRDDVRRAPFLADVVHRDDARVIAEARHRPSFFAHAPKARRVEALGLEEGDRDVAPDVPVMSEIDSLLGSLADQAGDPVPALGEKIRDLR
jgi:hypothetical protein